MSDPVLSTRALNRATLARQLLLAREATPALAAIERLAGLQAQEAAPPFVGLWTRLEGFRREELRGLLGRREVVRTPWLRATLHLVSAADFRALRGAVQPALTAALQSALRKRADGLDLAALAGEGRAFFEAGDRTFDDLRTALAERHPDGDVRAMAYAVRTHLPLVQVPEDGAPWAFRARACFAPAATWLDAAPDEDPRPHPLVRRYLAAFGPASVADAQAWSGLRGLRDAFRELRPTLAAFRDERGRELFDLPEAPRPPEDAAAPVRFLPEFDNLVLAHDDRSRIVADAHRAAIVTANLRVRATFLVDGFVAGTWRVERSRKTATLVVEPFAALPGGAAAALEAEGTALLAFAEPEARSTAVRIA